MLPATLFVVCGVGFVVGGMINPLYSLLISYTADYLDYEDMSAASGGLLFVNGCGAVSCRGRDAVRTDGSGGARGVRGA